MIGNLLGEGDMVLTNTTKRMGLRREHRKNN